MAEIWQTILSEFSDMPSLREVITVTLRLGTAGLLGGMIGYQRERLGKAAGLRTHVLVAMGTSLMVFIPKLAGMNDDGVVSFRESSPASDSSEREPSSNIRAMKTSRG